MSVEDLQRVESIELLYQNRIELGENHNVLLRLSIFNFH